MMQMTVMLGLGEIGDLATCRQALAELEAKIGRGKGQLLFQLYNLFSE